MKIISVWKNPGKRLLAENRRIVWLVLVLAFVLCAAPLLTAGRAALASAKKRELPIYCVEKDSKVLSLTFDAAWGNEDTEELISILGRYGVRATFFVVGEWVDKYPESVKALADAGHEVMNHSDDHPHFPKLSAEQMTENLNRCNDKIEKVTGVRPTLFRPPYGDYNDSVIQTVRGIGMQAIQWDCDSLDWKDYGADAICKRVLERAKPGSIVLFHNAAKYTPQALPTVIEGLMQKGYSFVPVSELLLTEDYEIDHSGMQVRAKTSEG